MTHQTRPFAFWVIICFLSLSFVLLIMGQTMAIINYDFAVQIGLQEDVKEVGQFGVQLNRAFGVGDTIIYIPLIAISIIGLILKKRWSLLATAAVMGISAYWATTIIFMLIFLVGTPDYYLDPGFDYWLFLAAFIIFGVWGLLYLIFRGEKLLVISEQNPFIWQELVTPNQKTSGTFFSKLFGWNLKQIDAGKFGTYTLFQKNGQDVAGMMNPTTNTPREASSYWHSYISVNNIDNCVKQASILGGKVLVPPHDVPHVGCICIVADPTGAITHLIQPNI